MVTQIHKDFLHSTSPQRTVTPMGGVVPNRPSDVRESLHVGATVAPSQPSDRRVVYGQPFDSRGCKDIDVAISAVPGLPSDGQGSPSLEATVPDQLYSQCQAHAAWLRQKRIDDGFATTKLIIEFCSDDDSELGKLPSDRCKVYRVTRNMDATKTSPFKDLYREIMAWDRKEKTSFCGRLYHAPGDLRGKQSTRPGQEALLELNDISGLPDICGGPSRNWLGWWNRRRQDRHRMASVLYELEVARGRGAHQQLPARGRSPMDAHGALRMSMATRSKSRGKS